MTIRAVCGSGSSEVVPGCLLQQISVGRMRGIVVEGIVAFVTVYIRRNRDNLSRPCTHHQSCVINIVQVALSCTSAYYPDVQPVLDILNDIKEEVTMT